MANRKCANNWERVERLVRQHGVPQRVAIEACSGAAHLADELIVHAGWPVRFTHPGYVARLKQSRDKTDGSDARLLADLDRVGSLPPGSVRQVSSEELKQVNSRIPTI